VGPSMRGGTVIDKDFLRETNTEWTKTYETQKKIVGIESDIDKANQKIIDGWSEGAQGMNDVRDAWDKYADEMINGTKKIDKELSQFWFDMKQGMKDFIMASSDKFLGQQFDILFKGSDIKEAYKDYEKQFALTQRQVERTGKTFQDTKLSFQEFSSDWKAQMDIQRQTWKDFLKDFLKDFVSMLAKKLLMYGLEKAGEYAIDKMTQKQLNEEIANSPTDNIGLQSPGTFDNVEKSKTVKLTDIEYEQNISGPGPHWHHKSYAPGSLGDWLDPDSEEDKAYKKLYGLANGGSGIVTKPTMFMMGEKGPESFNIQPLSKGNVTNRSDNFVVNISFPNATLDSVDQNQIDRFISKAIPSLRRAVSNGELS